MVLAILDLCFNVVCERVLLGGGARVLWLARGMSVPFEEQMQATLPDVCAGLVTVGLSVVALLALLR